MRRVVLAFFALAVVASSVAVGITIRSPNAAAATWPTVSVGASGANVYAIQHLLTARGRATTADGQFGPATKASVQAFQRASGLDPDGVVGPLTWAKLIVQVRQGNTGEAVKGAQRLLNKFGFGLAVDGAFGPATNSAARSFQSSHGLTVDGVVGPNTWSTLATGGGGGGGGGGTGNYRLVLPHSALPRSEYDDPHHDYPAIDLPVGTGTDAFAVTSGTISFAGGNCGIGIVIAGSDGATYTYCHLSRRAVGSGARVSPGQYLGDTGNTGNSTGPHLHFQIRSGGSLRCPQRMLLALYDGTSPPGPGSLPTSGCSN